MTLAEHRLASEQARADLEALLRPRALVTREELARMPPTLTSEQARPWANVSKPAWYRALEADGGPPHVRLGRAIRIPTARFIVGYLQILDEADLDGCGSESACAANGRQPSR